MLGNVVDAGKLFFVLDFLARRFCLWKLAVLRLNTSGQKTHTLSKLTSLS